MYFLSIIFKDDAAEIDKVVNSFNHSTANIVHIEFLDNNKAIAFYESLDDMYFGSAILKKGLFGWKSLSSSAGLIYDEDKLNWSFSNLVYLNFSNYTDLIRGKILDSEIAEVRIMTK